MTLQRPKRKRVAALSRWPVSQWIESCLWSVPLDQSKRVEAHQDGPVSACVRQMQWPKPKASKALFKDLTRTLETVRPRFGVCRRAEAMWQMINFSGRLETHGAEGGRTREDLQEYKAKETKLFCRQAQVLSSSSKCKSMRDHLTVEVLCTTNYI